MEKRYMMATKAIHQLGDISRDDPDICRVYDETETDYIGAWVSGFGFFNVHFPKETTRKLNPEEIVNYQNKHLVMSGMDLGPVILKKSTEEENNGN